MDESGKVIITKPKYDRRANLPPEGGPGRPKGVPNKATTEFRQTITALLEKNSANVELWLQQVATGSHGKDPDPYRALDLLAKLAEFAAPKLARTEVVGDAKQPLQTVIKWAQD